MKKFRIIYITSVVFLLNICFITCINPDRYIYIDQETKDYCLFGQGSYWIYQDSATLEIDSVVINNPIIYELDKSKGYSTEFNENYQTNILSYSVDSAYSIITGLHSGYTCNKSDLFSCLWGYHVIYHNGKINTTCEYYRNTILIDKKDNYSINGVDYSNVKIFKSSEYGEQLFYWSKHVGLIRTEKHKNNSITVKNLIKYNVKPYNN